VGPGVCATWDCAGGRGGSDAAVGAFGALGAGAACFGVLPAPSLNQGWKEVGLMDRLAREMRLPKCLMEFAET
jgi:hypothetical protein